MLTKTKIALSVVMALSAVSAASAAGRHPSHRPLPAVQVSTHAAGADALASVRGFSRPGEAYIGIQDRFQRESN